MRTTELTATELEMVAAFLRTRRHTMFHLTCIVEDRNLVKVLYALSGLVQNLTPRPIANVAPKAKVKGNGKIETIGETVPDLVYNTLKDNTGKITSKDIKEVVKKTGRQTKSVSYIIKTLVRDGRLKRGPVVNGKCKYYHMVRSGRQKPLAPSTKLLEGETS